MTDDLTIGIIGLGDHGRNHTIFLQELGHTIIGTDVTAEARQRFRDEFDVETIDEPLEIYDRDIDGVIIALPTKYHEAVTIPAFEADIDVLLEKPLANDLESARRIADAARRESANCIVGFQNKYLKSVSILNAYVDDGYFGDVTHVQGAFERRRGIPGRGSWYTSEKLAGGGAVMDIGTHVVDLVSQFFGYPSAKKVQAVTRTQFGDKSDYSYLYMYDEEVDANLFDVEDSATAFIDFGEGRTASLEVAWATNTRDRHEYQIQGSRAGAYLDITDVFWRTWDQVGIVDPDQMRSEEVLKLFKVSDKGSSHFVDSEIKANSVPARTELLRSFLSMIRSGTAPTRNTIEQALVVQEIVDGIYRSAETGDVVTFE